MRTLDSCLRLLEDACEGGARTVSPELGKRIAPYVAGVSPGMPVARAMDVVFGVQAHLLSTEHRSDSNRRSAVGFAGDLTRDQAATLTARIKAGARNLSLLILEAHQRRAWQALGYKSWEGYVRNELGLSRSRSYELIDHARVMLSIKVAAGLSECPEISPHMADRIRPVLGLVVAEIHRKTRDIRQDAAEAVVNEIIRASLESRGSRSPQSVVSPVRVDAARLARTVDHLIGMPSPSAVAASLSEEDLNRLHGLSRATSWLLEFERHVRNRQSARDSGLKATGGLAVVS